MNSESSTNAEESMNSESSINAEESTNTESSLNRILFSAIGTTDPVRDEHDGGWLHCLRWLHCIRGETVDKTILYLSADMVENEQQDGRYTKALYLFNNDLEARGFPRINCKIIGRPNLWNPHEYGNLYSDLKNILTDLHKRHPQAELCLNCSSGTPAMKNCLTDLRLILPFSDQIRLIQVSDPRRGQRENDGRVRRVYDLKKHWDENRDREPNPKVRAQFLVPDQHDKMIRMIYAKILIRQHDYPAAKTLLEEGNYFDGVPGIPAICDALEGASFRKMLLLEKASELLGGAGIHCDHLKEESGKPIRQCVEMVMTMEQDVKQLHYADMLRKISPVFFKLCLAYINKVAGWNPASYEGRWGRIRWEKLTSDHPDFSHTSDDQYMKSHELNSYIEVLSKKDDLSNDPGALDLIRSLRKVEQSARNEAAHTLVGIDDDWIFRNTTIRQENAPPIKGKDANTIIMDLKHLIRRLDPTIQREIWKSYQRMDEEICNLLDAVDLSIP